MQMKKTSLLKHAKLKQIKINKKVIKPSQTAPERMHS